MNVNGILRYVCQRDLMRKRNFYCDIIVLIIYTHNEKVVKGHLEASETKDKRSFPHSSSHASCILSPASCGVQTAVQCR